MEDVRAAGELYGSWRVALHKLSYGLGSHPAPACVRLVATTCPWHAHHAPITHQVGPDDVLACVLDCRNHMPIICPPRAHHMPITWCPKVGPADVLAWARALASGSDLRVHMLAYGNLDRAEAVGEFRG